MPIAILDPFSGISGDMTLGALVACGLDPDWLRALPARLGLEGVGVEIRDVRRGDIACTKVDFDIPPQPHGRGLAEIRALVARAGVPDAVQARAHAAFGAIAAAEGEIHGMRAEEVHLHEVGAVDAILDVVGAVWGFAMLGVTRVHCGAIALGDGTVRAAHGLLPVPAPATLKILEGLVVRPGPEDSGELVTPTGAALVRVLSDGPPPTMFVPLRSGFGAGTRDFAGRANALRLVLAEPAGRGGTETLVVLAADIDDMTGEHFAAAVEELRGAGALDVVVLATAMKKGRPGMRVEVLATPATADALEAQLLGSTTTIGVRRSTVERRALPRALRHIEVLGQRIAVKEVRLPDGRRRAKPELEDVRRAALATGRSIGDISMLAVREAER
ncbi:MAG TPA: nickel pincer cofactor biosynthesis protein LarC [Gemmatimonadaceae bacterium]